MDRYDVVVVGAGIQGAAVAQAVAVRGWSVLLLEQYDRVAQGTSSRSSKLIHGGLRYLESGQIALVRQCLRERRLLLRNAPGLVEMRPFYIPIYATTRRRPWEIRAGLSLYALLGGLRREARFAKIPRTQWGGLDGLTLDGLQAVYRYYDAQTDDAALTQAVAASAKQLGAAVSMSSPMIGARLADDEVVVDYQTNGQDRSCACRVMVNAGGPWVNRVLSRVKPGVDPMPIELVQGTHIVLPGATLGGIFYVEAPSDGRAVFVMPWQGRTLVGTTETRFDGDPATAEPCPEEIRYLLDTYTHYFPRCGVGGDDPIEAFAGLRVLPADTGSTFFSRTRETRLHTDRATRPRLLSIYGGKLTAYRAMAEKVVHQIEPSLPRRPSADTKTLHLTRPSMPSPED